MIEIKKIYSALAEAFGGYSQFSDIVFGHAIAGQINNNGMEGDLRSLAVEAAKIVAERWPEVDEVVTAQEIESAIRQRLAELEPEKVVDYEADSRDEVHAS